MDELFVEKTSEPTARSTWSSETGTNESPRFDDLQIPPVLLPTRITRGSEGETAIEFIRPLSTPRFGNNEMVGAGPIAR